MQSHRTEGPCMHAHADSKCDVCHSFCDRSQAYQSTSGRLYLVFEFVEHTLLSMLKAQHTRRSACSGLAAAQVKSTIWQLLKAISYMHKKNVRRHPVWISILLVTSQHVTTGGTATKLLPWLPLRSFIVISNQVTFWSARMAFSSSVTSVSLSTINRQGTGGHGGAGFVQGRVVTVSTLLSL